MVLSAVLEAAAATGGGGGSGGGARPGDGTGAAVLGDVSGVVHLSFSSASGPELVLRALEQARRGLVAVLGCH
jgi:hypothetical protein